MMEEPQKDRNDGNRGAADARKDTDADRDGTKTAGKNRLSSREATAALCILVFILAAFLIGMNITEEKAKEKFLSAPYETISADPGTLPDKSIPPENGLININTAAIGELMALDGIGEKKAQAIIDYRNEYGRFTSTEDLLEVPGIGDAVFQKIKDAVTI